MRHTALENGKGLDGSMRDDLVELAAEIATIKWRAEKAFVEHPQRGEREGVRQQADEDRKIRLGWCGGFSAERRLKRTSPVEAIGLPEKDVPRKETAGKRVGECGVEEGVEGACEYRARCGLKRR